MTSQLKELNIKATASAKRYMAKFASLTVFLVVLVVSGFIFNLTLLAQEIIPLWLAMIILSSLTYFSYTPLHEAVHENINGKHKQLKWLNDLCGYLVAPIIAIPYSSHRYEHLAHHAFTNQKHKDPDDLMKGMSNGLGAVVVISIRFLWLQNSYFFKYQREKSRIGESLIYAAELFVSLGWRIAFIIWNGTLSAFITVILGYLIGAIFTAYWFAYRPHLPYKETARYKNTASLIMPAWCKTIEWLWLGQNLHSIHHLFPRVPFYYYHQLHHEIEPVMRAHGTPIIGIFSRKAMVLKS